MSLESEMLADLRQLLAEHGVPARWKDMELMVLASRVDRSQQIELGGFVETPDLSVRVPKILFPAGLPKTGERMSVEGTEYRISQVSGHSRSPLLTLSLISADE